MERKIHLVRESEELKKSRTHCHEIETEWSWLEESGAVTALRKLHETTNWRSRGRSNMDIIIESSSGKSLDVLLQKNPSLATAGIFRPEREQEPVVTLRLSYNQFEIIPIKQGKNRFYRAGMDREEDVMYVTALPERLLEVGYEEYRFVDGSYRVKRHPERPLVLHEEAWKDPTYMERILQKIYEKHPVRSK